MATYKEILELIKASNMPLKSCDRKVTSDSPRIIVYFRKVEGIGHSKSVNTQ